MSDTPMPATCGRMTARRRAERRRVKPLTTMKWVALNDTYARNTISFGDTLANTSTKLQAAVCRYGGYRDWRAAKAAGWYCVHATLSWTPPSRPAKPKRKVKP